MPIGFGEAPLGTSLYGYGSVDISPVSQTNLFPDPITGVSQSARRINPLTRDYQFDSLGRVTGMTSAQQLFYLAVATVRNSSCLLDFGNPVATGHGNALVQDIQKIGSNFTKQVQDAYSLALKDLTDRKIIQLIAIDVNPFSTTGQYVTVRWADLTTGLQQATSL